MSSTHTKKIFFTKTWGSMALQNLNSNNDREVDMETVVQFLR